LVLEHPEALCIACCASPHVVFADRALWVSRGLRLRGRPSEWTWAGEDRYQHRVAHRCGLDLAFELTTANAGQHAELARRRGWLQSELADAIGRHVAFTVTRYA
jgi:hypothetical protein